jgi:hypothetical protein
MGKARIIRNEAFWAVMAAASLSACGGGSGGSGATTDSSVSQAPASVDAVAKLTSTDQRAVALAQTWTVVAQEGATFTVSGTQTVRYGTDTRWVEKTVAGSGSCTNAYFGTDPAKGTVKVCQVQGTTDTAPAQTGNVPPAGFSLCAAEAQQCNFTGSAQVVYGARTTWTSPRSFTGGVACNNTTFGDPLRGVVKACYAQAAPAPATATWTQIASEGQAFSVSGTKVVRFGVAWAGVWVSKNVTGAGTCDATFFGTDPKPGNAKTCEVSSEAVPVPTPAPTPPAVTWAPLATEGQAFTVNGTKVVRFGVAWADAWVTKNVTGSGTCSAAYFGSDPKPGNAKTCEVSSQVVADPLPTPTPQPPTPPASSPTPMNPGVVTVNTSLIPKGTFAGWDKDMLIPTTEQPAPSDIGAFRTGCQFSHMAFDDPIVYPGQPGKSHLHTFFGNKLTNANSTAQSLATTGNSTCRGGTINRSAYWVPSMIDTRDGRPLTPMFESNFYYKTGYGVPAASIQPMPPGLRMIAGDAKGNPDLPSGAAMYACIWEGGNSDWSNSIPSCPKKGMSWLIQGLDFPQCWDGVNLDSPDHKSHMANPVDVKANNTGHCPSTHPVAIPAIAYQILYEVKVSGETKYWRLSSDNYDLTKPAGYSGHGDWFNGWKPEIVDVWVKKCDRAMKDCHSHLLGDGRAMVIP